MNDKSKTNIAVGSVAAKYEQDMEKYALSMTMNICEETITMPVAAFKQLCVERGIAEEWSARLGAALQVFLDRDEDKPDYAWRYKREEAEEIARGILGNE